MFEMLEHGIRSFTKHSAEETYILLDFNHTTYVFDVAWSPGLDHALRLLSFGGRWGGVTLLCGVSFLPFTVHPPA